MARGRDAFTKAILEILSGDTIWIVWRRSKGDWKVTEDGVEEDLLI